MKFFVSLVLVAAAIASSTLASPRYNNARARHAHMSARNEEVSAQCPAENDPNAWAIHLPNPDDCGSYYVCDWGNAILMPCPSGLHFDADLQVCVWPQDTTCNVGQEPTQPVETTAAPVVTEEATTAAQEVTTQEPEPEVTTQEPEDEVTTQEPEDEVTTQEPEDEVTTQEPEEEVTTQEPEEEVTTQEPEEEVTTQEPEEEVTQEPEVTEAPSLCPAVGSAIVANPDDCDSFFVCHDGNAFLVTCAEGRAFDPRFATCTEAAEAECHPEVPEEPEVTTIEPEEEVTTQEPEDEVTTQEPEDEVTTQEPEEEVTTQEPEDEVTTQEPEDEVTTLEPEEPEVSTNGPTEAPAVTTVATQEPTAAPTTAAPTSSPKEGCEKVECPAMNGDFALHLPNPDSCTSFCKCDWGVAHHFDCPAGLHFNAVLEVCDWPQSANCQL